MRKFQPPYAKEPWRKAKAKGPAPGHAPPATPSPGKAWGGSSQKCLPKGRVIRKVIRGAGGN